MNGHEWWNPVADLTTAATEVVGAATDVADSVSNAWNSLPPTEQDAVIVTVAVVATVATVGVAAPIIAPVAVGALASVGVTASTPAVTGAVVSVAAGAGMSAVASLGVGLFQGNANAKSVLTAAAIGGVSGGAGAVGGILANAAVGAGATFADQQLNSYETTGHWGTISPQSTASDALGGAIGAFGGALGDKLTGLLGSASRATIVSTGATALASTAIPLFTPFSLSTGLGGRDILYDSLGVW